MTFDDKKDWPIMPHTESVATPSPLSEATSEVTSEAAAEAGEMPEPDWEKVLSGASTLSRLSTISTTVGGAALRWVCATYLGAQGQSEKHALQLHDILGDLKGPIMKIAQLLSTIPGALPPAYSAALSKLHAHAPPMGWPFVRRRMAGELGPAWQQHFAHFDRAAVAAASLGQVHKATHLDGTPLAVKLQYPDMGRIMKSDLSQLKFFLSLYETVNKALETKELYEELQARLLEELDYDREAAHLKCYALIFQDHPHIHVPMTYPALSTNRLLTMTWQEGRPLTQMMTCPQETRDDIATMIFTAWYKPLYHYGVIHGDPHFGNYSFPAAGGVNLLDFGCVRFFDGAFVGSIIALYRALESQDKAALVHAYEAWGFTNLSNDLIDTLTEWAQFLYDPLLDNRVRTIDAHHQGRTGHVIAANVHKKLHAAGGVCPPKEFVLMDRAAVGMGAACMKLQAKANWHALYESLIENFEATQVDARQEKLRAAASLSS